MSFPFPDTETSCWFRRIKGREEAFIEREREWHFSPLNRREKPHLKRDQKARHETNLAAKHSPRSFYAPYRSALGKKAIQLTCGGEDFNCSRELELLSHQAVIQVTILQCKYVRYTISCFTSFQMLGCFMSFRLRVFLCVRDERAKDRNRKTDIGRGSEDDFFFLVEWYAAGRQAAVSLPDALGVQLCGVNSQKTSLCSQKMRASRV